jgi:hypothetical protein
MKKKVSGKKVAQKSKSKTAPQKNNAPSQLIDAKTGNSAIGAARSSCGFAL